jgi:recyclin-1
LNPVVREKKRFEGRLDEDVARGLNVGTEVLMNQVEHIIQTHTPPRAYYPPTDAPLEIGPTRGCTEAVRCLETHCELLRGSAGREVMEVFYREVGLRLVGCVRVAPPPGSLDLTLTSDMVEYYRSISKDRSFRFREGLW